MDNEADKRSPRLGMIGAIRRSRLILPVMLITVGGVPTLLGLGGTPRISRMLPDSYLNASLDVLNSFLPFWVGSILLGLLLILRARAGRARRSIAVIGLLPLIVAGYPIAREAIARWTLRSPAAEGPKLRVLQFNAFAGNHDLRAAVEMIRRSDADVIAIEEPMKLLHVMPAIRRYYPYSTPCPGDCAAMLLARKRPLHARVDQRIGRWYAVANTPGNGPIEFARMDFAGIDGKPISIVGIHLLWPLPPAPAQHQLDMVDAYLSGVDRSRSILMGDFNLTSWSFAMRGLDSDLHPMKRVTRALFSWPVYRWNSPHTWPLPFLPIDHVFVGSHWQATQVRTLPRAGSDHLPVLVDLRLQG